MGEPTEELAGARDAHRRLLSSLADLDDETARRPSLLPGWTVGHVLTHVARNADSMERALAGAAAGVVVDRYPGGGEQRRSDIDEGAGRGATALVEDVRVTADRLEAAWASLPAPAWDRMGTSFGRPETIASSPFRRWREVEVHHADLGLGFGIDDWSLGYVTRELHLAVMAWRASNPMGLTELPPAALALRPTARLAWLTGRLEVDGLPKVPSWW